MLSYGPWQQLSYRGLTTLERDELWTLADTLAGIEKVIRDGQRINTSIGSDVEAWKTLLERCSSIEVTAEQTYKRSY